MLYIAIHHMSGSPTQRQCVVRSLYTYLEYTAVQQFCHIAHYNISVTSCGYLYTGHSHRSRRRNRYIDTHTAGQWRPANGGNTARSTLAQDSLVGASQSTIEELDSRRDIVNMVNQMLRDVVSAKGSRRQPPRPVLGSCDQLTPHRQRVGYRW